MSESNPIQQQKKFKVLLIGDNCVDIYQYGLVERISPEAPVPVVKIFRIEEKAGMSSNVQKNLEAFGINVTAILGPDSAKIRIVDMKSRQHIVRIDNDVNADPFIPEDDEFFEKLEQYDAIVISDYEKGFVSYGLVEFLISKFSKKVFVDTKKKNLEKFNGAYVKINEHEFDNAITLPDDLIVTLGSFGSALFQRKLGLEQKFTGTPVNDVVDVCGAGDTFLAALVYEYLNTNRIEQAIFFANRAAAVTVQHNGVYVLTSEDIEKVQDSIPKE